MSVPNLPESVRANLEAYFQNLGASEPSNMYDMLLHTVEKPLLEAVLARCGGNQSRAAQWLGLNRNTLRKKLQQHGLLN